MKPLLWFNLVVCALIFLCAFVNFSCEFRVGNQFRPPTELEFKSDEDFLNAWLASHGYPDRKATIGDFHTKGKHVWRSVIDIKPND